MDYRKDLLLASAARLYSMGVDLVLASGVRSQNLSGVTDQ